MKKLLFTAFLVSIVVFTSSAQFSLSVYSGAGRSSFDKDIFNDPSLPTVKFSQSSYVPLGAQLNFNLPFILSVGAEVNYAIVPYSFDINYPINGQDTKVAELKAHQLFLGVVAKARLLPGPIVPYARVGAGLISGDIDIHWTDQIKQYLGPYGVALKDSTINIKEAVGVNIGAGVEINFSESGGLFGEIVYYFIQREEDIKNAQSFQANNYGIQVGWQFKF
jgi:opacity protein-like surface antigen